MKEAPCKISASHHFPISQTPADTRVFLSPMKRPEWILTQKIFGSLICPPKPVCQVSIWTFDSKYLKQSTHKTSTPQQTFGQGCCWIKILNNSNLSILFYWVFFREVIENLIAFLDCFEIVLIFFLF